jgi:hypothetical protein
VRTNSLTPAHFLTTLCLRPLQSGLEDLVATLEQDVDSFPLEDHYQSSDGISVVEQNAVNKVLAEELLAERDARIYELDVVVQTL